MKIIFQTLKNFGYIPVDDSWSLSGQMSMPRHQAGCEASSAHGLIISGGCPDTDCTEAGHGTDTVERTTDGETMAEPGGHRGAQKKVAARGHGCVRKLSTQRISICVANALQG